MDQRKVCSIRDAHSIKTTRRELILQPQAFSIVLQDSDYNLKHLTNPLHLHTTTMSLPLRPFSRPQCSSCVRHYLSAGFVELGAPTITAFGQHVRGKKTMSKTSSALPVRLLKNVDAFGRKGQQFTNHHAYRQR